MPATVITKVAAGDTNAFETAAAAIDDAKWLQAIEVGSVIFIISKT